MVSHMKLQLRAVFLVFLCVLLRAHAGVELLEQSGDGQSILGMGYNVAEFDLWDMATMHGGSVYDSLPDGCIVQVDCSHTAKTDAEVFSSITEWSEYFSKSLDLEVGGGYNGVKASISASFGRSDVSSWSENRKSFYVNTKNAKACYQMTDDCLYNTAMERMLGVMKELPTGKTDEATMKAWQQVAIGRFGTHVAVGATHGASVKSFTSTDSYCEGNKSCVEREACLNVSFLEKLNVKLCSETKSCTGSDQCENHYISTCAINGGSSSFSSASICSKSTESFEVKRFLASGDPKSGMSTINMQFMQLDDLLARAGHYKLSKPLSKAIEYHQCHSPFAWVADENNNHTCQCALTCQNGGTLDRDSCTCKCRGDEAHGWKGLDCSDTYGKCIPAPGARDLRGACNGNNQCLSTKEHFTCDATEVCCNKVIHAKCCPFGSSCHCAPAECFCVDGYGLVMGGPHHGENVDDVVTTSFLGSVKSRIEANTDLPTGVNPII